MLQQLVEKHLPEPIPGPARYVFQAVRRLPSARYYLLVVPVVLEGLVLLDELESDGVMLLELPLPEVPEVLLSVPEVLDVPDVPDPDESLDVPLP